MGYRRYRSYSKPSPRNIEVKYAGPCASCGSTIKAGQIATYYPAGTITGISTGSIAHIGGLDGTSGACYLAMKAKLVDQNTNDYAGDGLDERYEDQCRDICGL